MRGILEQCKRFGVEFEKEVHEAAELHDLIERLRRQRSVRGDEGENTTLEKKVIAALREKLDEALDEIERGGIS